MCTHPGHSHPPVAAADATYRQVSKSPFGSSDEIGMLNLITPESTAEVLSRVGKGQVFDLSVDYFVGMPSFTYAGDPPFQMWMSHTPHGMVVDDYLGGGREQNELVSLSGDCITMYTHCGTHLDTLNHLGHYGEIWNGYTAAEHLGSRGWRVCGADRQPPIISRGVLIDVAALHGVDCLPESYGISRNDLEETLRRQGTAIRCGDVVLIRTGRMTRWPDADPYALNEPGLTRGGAEWLAQQGVIVIGADNIGLEQVPTAEPDNYQAVHTYLLAEAGIQIIEVVHLEEIAAEGLYEFAFIGACLRIRGATAAPIRPLALALRG